ncbi:MAG: O-antigen translocase [Bacteroidota bacterium]
MLSKILSVFRADIVKVSSFTAVSTAVKMVTGFVSVKIFASIIGPGGIALLGQLGNFSTIILTIASGGINSGVTKHIAENRDSASKVSAFINASARITFFFSALAGILLILFSGFLSKQILRSDGYSLVFIIFGFTIILYAFNNLLLSILNGFKEFKKYVIINIITSITGLAFSIALVLIWNIKGALVSYVTYQSVIFFITLAFVKGSGWFKMSDIFSRFNRSAGRQLINFSAMTFVSAMVIPTAQLFIRSYIVERLSMSGAGIWEGMNRISGMYLMIVTTSLSVYYLPKLAETKSNSELKREIIRVFRFIMPVMLIATISIFLFRDLIIGILFTHDFTSMRDLFKYQMTGDFFKIATWIVAYQMWAKGMTVVFISTEIIFNATLVLISVYCINHYRLPGATMAYMLNYILCFIGMVVIFRKQLLYAS